MDRYLYTEIHEILFCSFPVELCEWITKLAYGQGRWRLNGLIVWNPELVQRFEVSEGKIACAVNHWLDHIIGGFMIEFAVDTSISYSEAEHCFFKGPRGKYLRSLNTWIKMLLCEK